VVAAHDREFRLGRRDFAETHVAAVRGVELGLDVRVGEENKIERAWRWRRR